MKADAENTADLVDRAKRGDAQAFERLFGRFRNRIALWVSTKMGPQLRARLTADDVLQETFLQAHGSLPAFEDQGQGSFLRWLLSIAANRMKDLSKHHSAQKRDVRREAGAPVDRAASSSSPAARASRGELLEMLVTALERVPDPEREVVILRAVEERSLAEIAKHLGKSASAVGVLYVRGLEAMRRELGDGRR